MELINFVGHCGIVRYSTLNVIVDQRRQREHRGENENEKEMFERIKTGAETEISAQRKRAQRTEKEV